MDINSLPILDLLVLGALAASLIIGLMRGLVQEALSLLSWGGALFVGWLTYPMLGDLLSEWVPNQFFRNIGGGIIGFALALIVFNLISSQLSRLANFEHIRSTDRALGGLFGLIRGYILACVLFASAYWMWEDRQPPEFIQHGKTRPYIALGAKEIVLLLSRYEKTPLFQRLKEISEQGGMAMDLHQKLLQPEIEQPAQTTEPTGYENNERKELDKLFENN